MTAEQTLLIVEDEIRIAALLADYARSEGFLPVVLNSGEHVVEFVQKAPPSIILLDLMLPGTDGITICRRIRKISRIPIIMLTARTDETDILLGLKSGADDYICKPFSPREVMARVHAVLRRSTSEFSIGGLQTGKFYLDYRSHDLCINNHCQNLTPSEYGIIRLMMSHPQTVFSRKELLKNVQGYEYDGYNRTIDTHIKNLRKKIGMALPGRNPIVSVYGSGYKFDPGA